MAHAGSEANSAVILGVPVAGWVPDALIDTALDWADQGRQRTIHYANVHVLNVAHDNAALRAELQRADTVYCDGSGVRLAGWLLGTQLPPRMTGADWIEPFCRRAAQTGTRIFLLAGADGVAKRAADTLVSQHPGLTIVGVHDGFVSDPARTQVVLDEIARVNPQLVFVGMGTPIQELWIAKHRDQLGPRVIWSVGALLDFVTGEQRRGPRWMLDNHLEWAARLLTDPARLWQRYLLGNPLFLLRVARGRLRSAR